MPSTSVLAEESAMADEPSRCRAVRRRRRPLPQVKYVEFATKYERNHKCRLQAARACSPVDHTSEDPSRPSANRGSPDRLTPIRRGMRMTAPRMFWSLCRRTAARTPNRVSRPVAPGTRRSAGGDAGQQGVDHLGGEVLRDRTRAERAGALGARAHDEPQRHLDVEVGPELAGVPPPPQHDAAHVAAGIDDLAGEPVDQVRIAFVTDKTDKK